MKPAFRRADRVSSEIREAVASVLVRINHEPPLNRITITGVAVSDDLKHARIFYSLFPGEDPDLYLRALVRLRGRIRSELGRLIRLKSVPEIDFLYAETSSSLNGSNPESPHAIEKKSSALWDELNTEE
jgi:ribosome-binding factor A